MNDFLNDIEQCLTVLKEGGIILYPTDTVWGIGCDATNEIAIEKIIELKKRSANKSFVVLVASEKEILKHVVVPDLAVFDYLQKRNKPTSVIYENVIGFSENILAADGSAAIRICKDEFCKHLIKRFKKPIVSTSANFSGESTPQMFSEIKEAIKNGADYVVKYRQNDETTAAPSSIIKWKNGNPIIIRP